MIVKSDINIKELNITESLTTQGFSFSLVVWNDEVNTFDWVIETLVEVCQQSPEQAEQCAMFIHFQGKYAVKNGEIETLKSMCTAITDRGISASIEEIVNK